MLSISVILWRLRSEKFATGIGSHVANFRFLKVFSVEKYTNFSGAFFSY